MNKSHSKEIWIFSLKKKTTKLLKLKGWNKKSASKVVELINHGWTTVRDKGKLSFLPPPSPPLLNT